MILFSGTDCCGKNSVMEELGKATNYKYYICPRSPICNIVYDIIYNRITFERTWHNIGLINKFIESCNAYFVLISAEPNILLQRAKDRNEKHVSDLEVFKQHQLIYDSIFDYLKLSFDSVKVPRFDIKNNEIAETIMPVINLYKPFLKKSTVSRFIKLDNSEELQITIDNLIKKINFNTLK
jgi:thymidylate kinase